MLKNLVSVSSKFSLRGIQCRLASTNVNKISHAKIAEKESSNPILDLKNERHINEVQLLGMVTDNVTVSDTRDYGAFTLLTTLESPDSTRIHKDWHRVISYDSNLVSSIKKDVQVGKKVYVSGLLTYRKDHNTNTRKAAVIAKNIQCLSSDSSDDGDVK